MLSTISERLEEKENNALRYEIHSYRDFLNSLCLEEHYQTFLRSNRSHRLNANDLELNKGQHHGIAIIPDEHVGKVQVIYFINNQNEKIKVEYQLNRNDVQNNIGQILALSKEQPDIIRSQISKLVNNGSEPNLTEKEERANYFIELLNRVGKGKVIHCNLKDAEKSLEALMYLLPVFNVYAFHNVRVDTAAAYKIKNSIILSMREKEKDWIEPAKISSVVTECLAKNFTREIFTYSLYYALDFRNIGNDDQPNYFVQTVKTLCDVILRLTTG